MGNEYCEKHQWPGGSDWPCPDCAEVERLTKERNEAERCAMEQLAFRLKAEAARDRYRVALAVIVGEAANEEEMVEVARRALGEADGGSHAAN